jgi:hypothetical protein
LLEDEELRRKSLVRRPMGRWTEFQSLNRIVVRMGRV